MSEKDQADRLTKQWDALIRTPQAARPEVPWTGDRASDTVHELHALDDAARPDPEFRSELREQLLREAALRTGQHHAAARTSAIGDTSRPVTPSRRWIDPLAYAAFAALLVLVTAAIVWGIDLRGDRTDDVTPTTLIAATTPIGEMFATPEATPSVAASPTIPVSPTAIAQSTATPRSTPEPAATPQPSLDPTGTGTPVSPLACDTAVDPLGDVFLTLDETTIPAELLRGQPGSVAESVEITNFVTEFNGVHWLPGQCVIGRTPHASHAIACHTRCRRGDAVAADGIGGQLTGAGG